ncbi:hypothetical protein [Bradyrhizobium neotropicale]|uniref:hypothetical protein n=1 Tax=Bradyrhizobium neotropicale TaxID=1497615 RepID=UPI001FEF8017|nr:hypothetical protein [Bradyrhizobium neotropicale]
MAIAPKFPPHDVTARRSIALAGRRNRAYFKHMVQPVSASHGMTAPASAQGRAVSAIAWGAAGLGALAVLGAGALWFHYGTAVFFETIAAGVSACF